MLPPPHYILYFFKSDVLQYDLVNYLTKGRKEELFNRRFSESYEQERKRFGYGPPFIPQEDHKELKTKKIGSVDDDSNTLFPTFDSSGFSDDEFLDLYRKLNRKEVNLWDIWISLDALAENSTAHSILGDVTLKLLPMNW